MKYEEGRLPRQVAVVEGTWPAPPVEIVPAALGIGQHPHFPLTGCLIDFKIA